MKLTLKKRTSFSHKLYQYHTHPGVKIGLQAGSSCCVNLESESQNYTNNTTKPSTKKTLLWHIKHHNKCIQELPTMKSLRNA